MRALIVHAHPEPNAFVAGMRDIAAEQLDKLGYSVTVSDLYAMAFDPVAKASDFGDRGQSEYLKYALEQRHGFKSGSLSPDIAREVDRLLEADVVVFTFPIFWFSVPAILKGWIDRVFLSGPVYGGRRIYDCGGLCGKRALVGAALGGREHMFGDDAIHGDIHTMLRHFLIGTQAYSGMDVVSPFFAYHVPYVDEPTRTDMLKQWRMHVASIERLPVLPRPSLSDFDDTMRPLHGQQVDA